ncbi:MAG TPA: S8 family serine peptidase [Caldisericia bacterium]|nr:S8 family serine peptidase [Caldisericia bacterium]HPF49101.1 S8 family serine peptidase [Caldisericia bacterium]HPI83035.1 S8 family serine peptidase [Caldisericia bacterium]HPQ92262.1 S8 family serine peptidase [Caldisericia bacterium]HRV74640.1 S8 family serine peptidase [Caldisericia bacterium]
MQLKRVVSSIFLVLLLITSTVFLVGFSNYKNNIVNIVVTLDGAPVSKFLPENYVKKNIPGFDYAVDALVTTAGNSVEAFYRNNNNLFITKDHTYTVFKKGFSAEVYESDIERIKNLPGVVDVYKLPEYELFLDESIGQIRADEVWKLKDKDGNNITGKGIKVGIIDSGLDYRHEDLGGGYGAGYKVVDGYDFTGDDEFYFDGQNHGTHVAGIVAANGKVKGVAPDASLVAFKVFSGSGRRTNVAGNIEKAIETALLTKCDVVNMSLGAAGGNVGTLSDTIYFNAINAGITFCAAAGNNGARAPGKSKVIGYPSSIEPLISVAATDDTKHLVIDIEDEDSNDVLPGLFDSSPEWKNEQYEIVDCGYGNSDDDFKGLDLDGKIALIGRGPVSEDKAYFRYKVIRASRHGAAGCIIYNHSYGPYSGGLTLTDDIDQMGSDSELIPTCSVTYMQGDLLKRVSSSKTKISISSTYLNGRLAYFTSAGPSPDLKFKPDVAAPGMGIYSTLRTLSVANSNERVSVWAEKQGTSMACPIVSGAVALLAQKFPDETPELYKARLMSTATLLWNDFAGDYAPLTSQGSGRIDVKSAIEAEAVFSPPGATSVAKDNKAKFEFEMQNISNHTIEGSFRYVSLGGGTKTDFDGEMVKIKPDGTLSINLEVESTRYVEGIEEGIVFFDTEERSYHLPLMIQFGGTNILPQLSDLHVEDRILDVSDSNPVTVTFRLNFGSYSSDQLSGEFVTNNFTTARIDLETEDGQSLGKLLHDDNLQIGYYRMKWNGRDLDGFLQAANGLSVISGWGIRSISGLNNDVPTVIEQKPSSKAFVDVTSSSHLKPFECGIQLIPEKPSVDEEFEIRVSLKPTVGVFDVSFVLDYPHEYIAIDGAFLDTMFDYFGQIELTEVEGEEGRLFVRLWTESELATYNSGTCISFIAKPVVPSGSKNIHLSIDDMIVTSDLGKTKYRSNLHYFKTRKWYSFYDLNLDGVVNKNDFDILKNHVGSILGDELYQESMDFDADGRINSRDVIRLAKQLGKRLSP